ncbi:MAG: hypothetical protein GXP35_10660 [Actinobacteria bacterium]|nr:hypothetical protein [Actinomycetota bacterium]
MRFVGPLVLLALVVASCGSEVGEREVGGNAGVVDLVTETSPASTSSTTSLLVPVSSSPLPIQLCGDVDIPTPTIVGTVGQASERPFELDGVLVTYASEHPGTFAGSRIAAGPGNTLVLAFTDEPGPHLEAILARRPSEDDIAIILPRPPMTADWTVGESGYAFGVVQVEFSEVELKALQSDVVERLFGRSEFQLSGTGSGNLYNRVTLDIIRPTEADLELIAAEFSDRVGMFCLSGELWDESQEPPSIDAPFTVMADAGSDPLVDCRTGRPFLLSALDGPPDIDADSDDPLVVALMDERIDNKAIRLNGWRTLTRDDKSAVLANFEVPNRPLLQFFEYTDAGWSSDGSSAGECRLSYALPEGLGRVGIRLDPEQPLDPTSATVHLLVNQVDCAGGASGIERMQRAEVIETDDVVRVAIGVVSPEGDQTCPSNELAPITIELSAPLGDRELLDGIWVEPTPVGPSG